jgi:hypothetical protein
VRWTGRGGHRRLVGAGMLPVLLLPVLALSLQPAEADAPATV